MMPIQNVIQEKTTTIQPFQIIIEFGPGIGGDLQSQSMFKMEKWLREQGVPVEVYKATKEDDSKLRRNMTPEQRAKL